MSLVHRIATLVLAAALGAATGDRGPVGVPGAGPVGAVPGRPAAEPGQDAPHGNAASRAMAGALLPGFVTFGWVSPPADSTTEARVAEMAGAGLALTLPAWLDQGRLADNLARLDYAATYGMRCLIWDGRFERLNDLDPDSPAGGALLDSIVADYRDHPAFFGYYLGDEPPVSEYPLLVKLFEGLRQRDPAHPAWNNLLGRMAFADGAQWRAYVRTYLRMVRPAVLCDDQYDFLSTGDRGQFVENAAGLRELSRAAGIPFWGIVLLVQHGGYRAVTPAELEWQVAMLLAYGARGIGYFTYWTPAPDSVWNWQPAVIGYDGRRTAWYGVVAELDRRVRPAGGTLAALTWLATVHAGGTPAGGAPFRPDDLLAAVEGRAALGCFADSAGTRYLLVVNSDSLAARTLGLVLGGTRRVWRLGTAVGEWNELPVGRVAGGTRVALGLVPGGFALLRAGGDAGPAGVGFGPDLVLLPNPARRELRLQLARLTGAARLEILDASGRRIWSQAVGAAEASLTWRGEGPGGRSAPPGLYFVRVRDAQGVAAVRLHWLGSR